MSTVITPHMEAYIGEHYLDRPISELARELEVSRTAVRGCMRRNGWKVPPSIMKERKRMKPCNKFTPEEDNIIHKHIYDMILKALARKLKRDPNCVSRRAKELGYGDLIRQRKKNTRFRKGHEGWNKGMKMEDFMTPEAIEKVKKNRFQKGHKPHNTKYDGYVSLQTDDRGASYYHLRISEGNFISLHQYVWERKNGPVTEGHIVVFRNGDTTDMRLDNLEMISRQELMLRNCKHDLPPELIPTMALNARIKKQIKIYEEQTNRSEQSPIRPAGAAQ